MHKYNEGDVVFCLWFQETCKIEKIVDKGYLVMFQDGSSACMEDCHLKPLPMKIWKNLIDLKE